MLDIKLSQNWQPEALSALSLKEDAGMAAPLNRKRLLYSGEELKYGVRGIIITHSFCRNEAHLNHGNNIYSKWQVCNFTTGSKKYSVSFLPGTQ